MWYEVKFGLIGFVVGTVAISATTFASNITADPTPVAAATQAPIEHLALLPTSKPVIALEKSAVVAKKPAAGAAPKPAKTPWMSEWRRAYIAKHGHQPPVPAA